MGAIQSSNSFPYFQFHLTPSVEEVEEEERRERQQNEQRTGGGKDCKGKNRNSDKWRKRGKKESLFVHAGEQFKSSGGFKTTVPTMEKKKIMDESIFEIKNGPYMGSKKEKKNFKKWKKHLSQE